LRSGRSSGGELLASRQYRSARFCKYIERFSEVSALESSHFTRPGCDSSRSIWGFAPVAQANTSAAPIRLDMAISGV